MIATDFHARSVIDTNVFVSAAVFIGSVSGRAMEAAFARGAVLMAEELIAELGMVLARRKFERHITPLDRRSFLSRVTQLSTPVTVTSDIRICRDPRDNHILNLAVDGRATHIITGDEDLLLLHPFRGVEILTPAQFLSR